MDEFKKIFFYSYLSVFLFQIPLNDAFAGNIKDYWEKYKNLIEIKTEFKQTKRIKEVPILIKTQGKMKFKKPDLLEWHVTRPSQIKIIFTKSEVTFIENGKTNTLDLNKIGRASKLFKPIEHLKAWLKLDYSFLVKNYKIENKKLRSFKFLPKKEGPFAALLLTLNKKGLIKNLKVNEKGGDTLFIEFFNTTLKYE